MGNTESRENLDSEPVEPAKRLEAGNGRKPSPMGVSSTERAIPKLRDRRDKEHEVQHFLPKHFGLDGMDSVAPCMRASRTRDRVIGDEAAAILWASRSFRFKSEAHHSSTVQSFSTDRNFSGSRGTKMSLEDSNRKMRQVTHLHVVRENSSLPRFGRTGVHGTVLFVEL